MRCLDSIQAIRPCDHAFCDCIFTGAIPFSNAYFGSGTGAVLIDDVSCTGSEQFLANCTNNGIGNISSICGHDDDAGVQCPGINI